MSSPLRGSRRASCGGRCCLFKYLRSQPKCPNLEEDCPRLESRLSDSSTLAALMALLLLSKNVCFLVPALCKSVKFTTQRRDSQHCARKEVKLSTEETLNATKQTEGGWGQEAGVTDIGESMCYNECCEVCKPGDSRTCTPGANNTLYVY